MSQIRFLRKIVLIIFLIENATLKLLPVEEEDYGLKDCVKKVLEFNFDESSTVYVISADDLDINYRPHVVINLTKPVFETSKTYAKNFVLSVRDGLSLNNTLSVLRKLKIWSETESPRGKFIIISSTSAIESVFTAAWYNFILNFAVIVKNSTRPRLHTSNAFAYENQCGKLSKIIQSQECNSSVMRKGFRQYTGCTIRINSELYSSYHRDPDRMLMMTYVDMLINYLNVSVEFFSRRRNGTNFYGGHRIHLIYIPVHSSMNGESVGDLFRSSVVWLVPLPEKISPLEVLLKVFSGRFWTFIFACVLIVSAIWWMILVIYEGKCDALSFVFVSINILRATCTGSLSIVPKHTPLRCLFIMYLLYIINIQTAYTSNLVRIFANPPYEKGIDSVEELAHSGLTIYSVSSLTINFRSDGKYLSSKIEDKLVTTYKFKEKITEVANYRNCAMVIPEFGYIEYQSKVPPVRVIYDDTFTGTFAITLLAKKGHYVSSALKKFYEVLRESGIYEKNLENHKRWSYEYNNYTRPVANSYFVVLELKHLYVVFLMLFIGLLTSCVAFFFEQVWYEPDVL